MKFTITALSTVLATLAAVSASPIQNEARAPAPVMTTQTLTFIGTRIYETIVPEAPYWLTLTTTFPWTQTRTTWVQPTPTA